MNGYNTLKNTYSRSLQERVASVVVMMLRGFWKLLRLLPKRG
jgi:hypothetical protein